MEHTDINTGIYYGNPRKFHIPTEDAAADPGLSMALPPFWGAWFGCGTHCFLSWITDTSRIAHTSDGDTIFPDLEVGMEASPGQWHVGQGPLDNFKKRL